MIRPQRRSPNSKTKENSSDAYTAASAAAATTTTTTIATSSSSSEVPRRAPPRRMSSVPSLSAEGSNHARRSSLTVTMGGSTHEPRRRTTPVSPRKRGLRFRQKRRIRRGFGYWCQRRRLMKIGMMIGSLFVFSFGIAFSTIRMVHLRAVASSYDNADDDVSRKQQPRRQHHNNNNKSKHHHPAFQMHSKTAPLCTPLSSPEEVTFTLVTQCSDDRLWMMEHHCHRWKSAPMSIAVFTDRNIAQVREDLRHMHCPVDDDKDFMTIQTIGGYSEEDYPVNVLRNTALKAVKTTHVVYVDIDFWESMDLSHTLHLHRDLLYEDSKAALVIPAFQLNRQCTEWRDCREKNIPVMPRNRGELLDLLFDRKANPFDPTNPSGHGTTRYGDWLDQAADELLPIECTKSNRYEPYLVFRYCHDLPPFQVAFTGYGKNKMTWVMHLRRLGYQFWQLGESFVVHYPHLDSKSRMHWNGGDNGEQLHRPKDDADVDWLSYKRGQIDQTFLQFRTWLQKHVPDHARVPMCEDAMDDDQRLWVDREHVEGE